MSATKTGASGWLGSNAGENIVLHATIPLDGRQASASANSKTVQPSLIADGLTFLFFWTAGQDTLFPATDWPVSASWAGMVIFPRSRDAIQFLRFALVGVVSTAVYAATYAVLVKLYFPNQLAAAAVPFAFATALSVGYCLNASWSFRGQGDEGRPLALKFRYLLVQLAGFAINLALTWIATAPMGLPTWTPLVPACIITPLVTFALQRRWVFA